MAKQPTSSFESYSIDIQKCLQSANAEGQRLSLEALSDIAQDVNNRVENFINQYCSNLIVKRGTKSEFTQVADNVSFETLVTRAGADKLTQLVSDCHIPSGYVRACCEEIAIAMDRAAKNSQNKGEGWHLQTSKADHSSNGNGEIRPLTDFYPDDVASNLSNFTVGQEAFGANIDMVVPDMKITITTAIMNFHARIMPRLVPTRTTDQNNVSITKEYLEVYDNSTIDGKSSRLVDLYDNPELANNELKDIIALEANDADHKFVVKDGILKFNEDINLIKLSLDASKPGYERANRTDLVEENVRFKYAYVSLTANGKTEVFQCAANESYNRLSRVTDGRDSADRGKANLRYRVKLYKNTTIATSDIAGDWESKTTEILANLPTNEYIELTIAVSPYINLKNSMTTCTGSVRVKGGNSVDNTTISETTQNLVTALQADGAVALVGYTLDAKFSEANLRKTNIAVMTHRVPHSYDIPVGRNYTFDYAIGQVNAEENAVNLTKIIGIGQDNVQLNGIIRLIEQTYDRINTWTPDEAEPNDYVGADFAAGDKVRPTIYMGTLDFSNLNIIRDADRYGDVKQKAESYLNGVIAQLMQKSFLQQQLGGGTTATFKMLTSHQILQNIFAPQHIFPQMCKDDQRDLGDGIEFVIELPGGVRIECITSTFRYMLNKCILIPVIPSNAESELNFGALYNNGNMVAHYTISGDNVNHRLFANIRELFIPTNPVAAIIDVAGIDVVNGLSEETVLRPTMNTVEVTAYQP